MDALNADSRRNIMRVIQISIACVCALLASAVMADVEKSLVCHVGSEAGPNGETYLDDPTCVPSDANAYFCPDAGKVDLLVVAKAEKHLDNASHSWDGFFDYEPSEVGASGDGTEDTDGDGIDEGCQPPPECPCWNEFELQQVTADNQLSDDSCDSASDYDESALIQDDQEGVDDGVEGGFIALNGGGISLCATRDGLVLKLISEGAAASCIQQIAERCAAIKIP
jgi:hypothetical protein